MRELVEVTASDCQALLMLASAVVTASDCQAALVLASAVVTVSDCQAALVLASDCQALLVRRDLVEPASAEQAQS